MGEYSYPSGDAAAFIEEMNAELAPPLRVVEIDGLLSPRFTFEGTETITSATKDSIRRVGAKYWRAGAMFADNTFWFFAQV